MRFKCFVRAILHSPEINATSEEIRQFVEVNDEIFFYRSSSKREMDLHGKGRISVFVFQDISKQVAEFLAFRNKCKHNSKDKKLNLHQAGRSCPARYGTNKIHGANGHRKGRICV